MRTFNAGISVVVWFSLSLVATFDYFLIKKQLRKDPRKAQVNRTKQPLASKFPSNSVKCESDKVQSNCRDATSTSLAIETHSSFVPLRRSASKKFPYLRWQRNEALKATSKGSETRVLSRYIFCFWVCGGIAILGFTLQVVRHINQCYMAQEIPSQQWGSFRQTLFVRGDMSLSFYPSSLS